MFVMAATRHVLLDGPRIKGFPKQIVLFLATLPKNIARFSEFSKPLAIKSVSSLENGFNSTMQYRESKDYLLIAAWDDTLKQSIVKLVRIRDGKILYKWAPDISLLNENANTTKFNTRLLHPFLMNDGSLIFGAKGTHKVDKSSKLLWSSKSINHHSIEPDSDGNFWVCSWNPSDRNTEKYHILDDAIQKISASTGEMLFEKSVFEILMENGYEKGVFFINPQVSAGISFLDYIHLNDIQPVFEDSPYWKKGDLFLSLRHQNLVLLYRPSTNKIIWFQNGPWLRQHDVDVIDSCRIGVFGNDVIDAKFADPKERLINGHNNEYIFNFSTNKCTTPYNEFFHSANIGTFTEGRSRVLSNGDIFVEESNNGRIIFGNYTKEIWSYVERIDKKHFSVLNWSRYITEEEFKKFTFIDQKAK